VFGFVLIWRLVAQPRSIVKRFDVREHAQPGIFQRLVLVVLGPFVLQRPGEPFGHRDRSRTNMPRPDLLPIKRMDDLHTDLIGCSSEGQFMIIDYSDGPDVYVVRYLFHMSGELNNVRHSTLGKDASQNEIQNRKNVFLRELEPYQLCDIRVQLFEARIGGIAFGLVYFEETQSVNLEPGPLITFMAPWDGEYYT